MERWLATAIKQHYLRYPEIIIALNIRRQNKKEFIKNYLEYRKYCKRIKEKERLNNKELIKYNSIRIIGVIIKTLGGNK